MCFMITPEKMRKKQARHKKTLIRNEWKQINKDIRRDCYYPYEFETYNTIIYPENEYKLLRLGYSITYPTIFGDTHTRIEWKEKSNDTL